MSRENRRKHLIDDIRKIEQKEEEEEGARTPRAAKGSKGRFSKREVELMPRVRRGGGPSVN